MNVERIPKEKLREGLTSLLDDQQPYEPENNVLR